VLLAAAAGGTWLVISKRQAAPLPAAATPAPIAAPAPTSTPEPGSSTAEMTAAQFKDEVSRRLAEEMKKLDEEANRQRDEAQASRRADLEATAAAVAAATPTPAPTAVVVVPVEPTQTPSPTATPEPVRETPPAILKVVKPLYPPVALQARIGGIVILRVLVSETGQPLEIEVMRGGKGGLTEAAVSAVRKWTFTPARRGETPVRAWTTVPIPFEP
jgi:protein TonB